MPKQNGANGEHVVTMREVAKAAGVSIKTVSNVVNDYEFVSQATRDKVNKAIDELGYTLNVSARNLRRGQAGFIGLAIPDLQMPYFAQLSSLVIEEAKKLGLRPDWAFQIIKQVGNYGESFEANLGPKTPLGLSRGLNRLWTKGGILISPPIR